ncbi:HD domain-containing protein [bacterium]|nr:HD domain-containing protein [bacterium]MCB9479916.1 HD domain-containing protein [Deltaproteobacteria bacterium]
MLVFTPFVIVQSLAAFTVNYDSLFNAQYVVISLALDLTILFLAGAFVVSNVIAKRMGPHTKRFHYASFVAFLCIMSAAAVAHMHFMGTFGSMQAILMLAVNAILVWYLRYRHLYIVILAANLAVMGVAALEFMHVLPYAPFIKHNKMLAELMLDPRTLTMNAGIYAIVNAGLIVILLYYRHSLEKGHEELEEMHAQLETHNEHLQSVVNEQHSEIVHSHMATLLALAKLAESRDEATGRHVERVQNICRALAEHLSVTPGYRSIIDERFISNIYYASSIHDIGKVGIEDQYLRKTASLTDREHDIMKRHTILGAEILEAVFARDPSNDLLRMGIAVTRHHHERCDGSGYPDGLSGKEIPLAARIMAVADVYDALRSERPYKKAFTHEESLAQISAGIGTQYDADVVHALLTIEARVNRIWLSLADENFADKTPYPAVAIG